jgi:pimeloyl-ACP methyl ester carboxylesterase
MSTYLLIPGAGGAAWYWHRLVPELRARGHEAVAVDLPAGDDAAGLPEYLDAAVAAVTGHAGDAGHARHAGDAGHAGHAGDDLVVVGQSMGGLTAPLVCRRLPVTRLVLVNAMIPAPGETGGAWWTNTGQEEARRAYDIEQGRDPDGPFDPLLYFFHDVPDDVTKEGMAGEPPQSGTPFEQPWPLAAWPDVPTEVLVGRDDRLFPAEFQARVAKERLGITPRVLPGGHLIALSRPAELAAALAQ